MVRNQKKKDEEERDTETSKSEPPPTDETYKVPPLSILTDHRKINDTFDKRLLLDNAKILEKTLSDFGVEGRVSQVRPGPVITLFEVEPGPGVKVNKILSLVDDLQLALSALSVRIIAPIPGKSAVGIEISNKQRETVFLKEIIENQEFQSTNYLLPLAFGKDISGDLFMADLQKMPHLLIAGATGAGKSVFLNALICSLLYRFTPEQIRVLMIDPKMLELTQYEGVPHLLMPVITDTNRAALALKWAVREMERRYDLMSKVGARNIEVFNKKIEEGIAKKLIDRLSTEERRDLGVEDELEKLPYIIVVVDELSDLMMIAAKDVELSIARLAQMARAGGIHLVISTQRPSVDVLTGLIKANFPARVSFQVPSKIDSRTILDTQGAERLLGDGDMLFLPPGTSKLVRIHAPFVSDPEVAQITEFLRAQGKPMLDESVLQKEEEQQIEEMDDFEDALYDQAVAVVQHSGQASISMVQRRLRIGYNRAARMIERMEMEGIVGPSDGVRPRDVLVQDFD
ncbi:DNA translocase FtsK [Bdellovibrionota bacterium]